MNTSEPSTGEIVQALRICGTDSFRMGTCEICSYNGAGKETFGCIDKLDNDAADRLESQEREIERLREAKPDWKREVTNPTHADFARVYRELAERKMNANGIVCVDTAMIHQAASIIESQMIELSELPAVLTALTARAEQAEAQRDEAWDALDKRCEECFYSYDPKDEICIECAIGVWRGLPQEGEGL